MNTFLIFCAGFTFAIGFINLIIGTINKQVKIYLYFGLLSWATSVFLVAQITPIFNEQGSELSNILSMVTASIFYSLIPLFCGEFTGYKKPAFQILIVVLIGVLLVNYILNNEWEGFGLVSSIVSHLLIFAIGVYGLIAGLKGKNKIRKIWLNTYLFLMMSLAILAIIVGMDSVFGVEIVPDPEGFISPLDFFPVVFSVIIGYKISHDIIKSYRLETEIKVKDRQWSQLVETVNLIIVQLDLNGKVVWVNTYFLHFSGYEESEIIGENWFDKMLLRGDKETLKNEFQQFIQGNDLPSFKNHIQLKDESSKSIQWSNISLQNPEGVLSGSLSIGADITELESALVEIKNLKDQLEKENLQLREEIEHHNNSTDIIGQSDALKYVIKRAQQVANTSSTVLLEGETGVGKELFANLIHEHSLRRHKPFIKVNCASLPKELIESELFGHVKGSFTGAIANRQGRFELADKGTIFLDEIGELPLDLQPKLLRVLQTGEFERIGSEKTTKVDVRIITATNRNLELESDQGNFRKDLFFRLNVYPITIPPLRQRKEDVPLLIRYFTNKIGKKVGKRIKHISKADIKMLQEYEWPGNVRELENVIERAIINSTEEKLLIDEQQLKSTIKNGAQTEQNGPISLDETQKDVIISTLEACNWRINGQEGAAQKLGLPPSTLRSKMKKLGIDRPL